MTTPVLLIGDSKTEAQYNTWPGGLSAALNALPGQVMPVTNIGLSSTTVASWAAGIDAALVGVSADAKVVLINLGANDTGAVEATWKANYLYILDAIHTKLPYAAVYLTRPWRRSWGGWDATFAAWIADIVAARAFAHDGDDERMWLENGDDGATNTVDGIHYSAAGQAAAVVAKRAVMGY